MDDLLTKALLAPRMKELRSMLKFEDTQDDIEEECYKLWCLTGFKMERSHLIAVL